MRKRVAARIAASQHHDMTEHEKVVLAAFQLMGVGSMANLDAMLTNEDHSVILAEARKVTLRYIQSQMDHPYRSEIEHQRHRFDRTIFDWNEAKGRPGGPADSWTVPLGFCDVLIYHGSWINDTRWCKFGRSRLAVIHPASGLVWSCNLPLTPLGIGIRER